MALAKQKDVEIDVIIDGKEQKAKFKLQHPGGLREAAVFLEETAGDSVKRTDRILKEVAMGPSHEHLTWDDFEQYDNGYVALQNLTLEAIFFLTGTNSIKPKG